MHILNGVLTYRNLKSRLVNENEPWSRELDFNTTDRYNTVRITDKVPFFIKSVFLFRSRRTNPEITTDDYCVGTLGRVLFYGPRLREFSQGDFSVPDNSTFKSLKNERLREMLEFFITPGVLENKYTQYR